MTNLYDISAIPSDPDAEEFVRVLLRGAHGLRVEQIVSHGQVTPEGQWYDQDEDEWVVVLEGEARLRYADGGEVALGRGDYLFLPRHRRHRVVYTSVPCVWLAIFSGDLAEVK
jgi:cupin 2 domain-containing protein